MSNIDTTTMDHVAFCLRETLNIFDEIDRRAAFYFGLKLAKRGIFLDVIDSPLGYDADGTRIMSVSELAIVLGRNHVEVTEHQFHLDIPKGDRS